MKKSRISKYNYRWIRGLGNKKKQAKIVFLVIG
jgi:hypothetical protein